MKEIRDRTNALGGQHLGQAGADAFDVLNRCRELQHGWIRKEW
jgi:hypothetical protein